MRALTRKALQKSNADGPGCVHCDNRPGKHPRLENARFEELGHDR